MLRPCVTKRLISNNPRTTNSDIKASKELIKESEHTAKGHYSVKAFILSAAGIIWLLE